jgi:ribosomal protein S17
VVEISECAPISKKKTWEVMKKWYKTILN